MAKKAILGTPEYLRLDADTRRRVTAYHARLNKRLNLSVTRAEAIRQLVREALDAAEEADRVGRA